jgi:hypothetical protein
MAEARYREQKTPKISANELARFMVATDTGREGIIRNARWQGTVRVARYRGARDGLARFLCDRGRSWQIIADARRGFDAILNDPTATPFKHEDARASIVALDTFQRRWNQLPFAGLNFEAAQKFAPLEMDGVKVGVALDAVVRLPNPSRVGGVLLRMSRGGDGETENAASKRREIGRNAAVLVFLCVSARMSRTGTPSHEHCFSVDVQHGEAHQAPRNYLAMAENMRAACRTIVDMWDRATPPGSA